MVLGQNTEKQKYEKINKSNFYNNCLLFNYSFSDCGKNYDWKTFPKKIW